MKKKEMLEELSQAMSRWQRAETKGLSQTSHIMEQTDNRLTQLVMEVIQRDSHMHHRVQQVIRDSLETTTLSLSPEELGRIWDEIEKHIATERETIDFATSALETLQQGQGRSYLLQQYLLSYLLEDEKKHEKLLSDLELIKRNMYPYG